MTEVGHGQDTGGASVDRRHDGRPRLLLDALDGPLQSIELNAVADEEVGRAHQDVAAIHLRLDALSRHGLEALGFRHDNPACARRRHNRLGQRVLGAKLGSGDQAQELGLGAGSVEQRDLADGGVPLSDRPGLVQDHGGDAAGRLQRLAGLEEDPHLGAPPGPDHHGCRRRQAHGARAGDDQHGHGVDHGLGQDGVAGGRSRADEIPGQECQGCDRQDDRDEDRRDAVRQALDGSLGGLRLLDQADDLRQGRVRADAPGFGLQAAEAVERAADDLVVSALLHRHQLPGQHRLIDRRTAFQDAPVDRDLLPRLDDENVADAHLLDRDFEFLAASHDARRFRAQAHQTPDGVARPAARSGLQQLAQDDQGDDDGGGLEVQVAARQAEDDRHGVEVGGRRAHGDQHVHVGGAVAQRLEGAAVVLAAGVELDRRRQRPLHPAEERRMPPGHRQQPEIGGHRQGEERDGETQADDQAPALAA